MQKGIYKINILLKLLKIKLPTCEKMILISTIGLLLQIHTTWFILHLLYNYNSVSVRACMCRTYYYKYTLLGLFCISYIITTVCLSVRVCVRPTRQFRVLMDRRNWPERSDSENGNRPGQSDSENGNPGPND